MKRMIALIGAVDEKGAYGVGPYLPWGHPEHGRSMLTLDMRAFVHRTRNLVPTPGTKNVLIVGKATAETFNWMPLGGRRLIILSRTLDEETLNAGRDPSVKVVVARSVSEAVERAQSYSDCGNIFFGGGETVWLEALASGLCNAAFITVVKCDAVDLSPHEGVVRRLPRLLENSSYPGMRLLSPPDTILDLWGDREVGLEFRTYLKD